MRGHARDIDRRSEQAPRAAVRPLRRQRQAFVIHPVFPCGEGLTVTSWRPDSSGIGSSNRRDQPLASGMRLWMSAVRSRHRHHRRAASCARIRHAVTCRSQCDKHLFAGYAPPVGLSHLPLQFAAWSSHRKPVIACTGELSSPPMPMRMTATKRYRAMFEPPEKRGRAT